MKKELSLTNIVYKEGKYFVAQCLNVEVSSFGKTKKEALENLEEALDLYFEDADDKMFSHVEKPELVQSHLRYA